MSPWGDLAIMWIAVAALGMMVWGILHGNDK